MALNILFADERLDEDSLYSSISVSSLTRHLRQVTSLVLSALEITIPKSVSSVLAGACLLNTTNGRRYSLMGPLLFSYFF